MRGREGEGWGGRGGRRRVSRRVGERERVWEREGWGGRRVSRRE